MRKFALLSIAILSFFIFQQKSVFAATGFAKPNLAGTWYVYIMATELTKNTQDSIVTFAQKPGYVKGLIYIDKQGRVIPSASSLTFFDFQNDTSDEPLSVTGGALVLSKDGTITGAIEIGETGTESIQLIDSKMDKGKTVISGIVKNVAIVSEAESIATIGMFSAVKR